jgi:CRISPR system Cascade subunit CasB
VPDDALILARADALVRDVKGLIKNPADRAVLRHSLGRAPDEVALDVHRIVMKHVHDVRLDPAAERAFYAVPAYIAEQPRQGRDEEPPAAQAVPLVGRRRNLGDSLARAVHDKGLNQGSTENRLQLLARQNLDGLYRQMPRLVLYLRGRLVPIDWALLIQDLSRWDREPKQVAKKWMQSYYRTSEQLLAEKKRNDEQSALHRHPRAADGPLRQPQP